MVVNNLSAKTGGRPRTVDMRGVVDGIFYILVAGCAWCLLPHDFPKWKTVYHYFRQWRISGDWERIHEQLRKWVRAIEDHHPSPSAAVLDSQSVHALRWLVYPCFINSCDHLVSKTYMTRVEGENTGLRHYLARLKHKTLCYSKCEKMLRASIKLLLYYLHFDTIPL